MTAHFTAEQIEKLSAPLDRKHVAQRSQAGRQLSYIEGWHAIAEANRVFGFDGWSSETVDLRMVAEGERQSNNGRKLFTCTYTARCRITVYAGSRVITREGVGAGHGMDQDAGQAHEKAIKEAETDSRKRALMTFGNVFGLALYDKTQANVSDASDQEHVEQLTQPKTEKAATPRAEPPPAKSKLGSAAVLALLTTALDAVTDLDSYTEWVDNNGSKSGKWDELSISQRAQLAERCKRKYNALAAAA